MNNDTTGGDFVTVTVGDHEVTMTRAEAAALTDAKRAELASECAGVEASITAQLRARAAVGDRARAAVAEKGAIVVTVWCDRCGDGVPPIAEVRRFSAGYVFDGRGSADMDPDQEAQHLRRLRASGAGRVRSVVEGRVQIILTEARSDGTEWPPRAKCPMHGQVDVDPAKLIQSARSAKPGSPTKMTVHPSA